MGVYIDMEMPEKTYAHCMLIKDLDGSVQLHVCTKNSEEISEWEYFDLVPVPPHGRLIDADEMARKDNDDFLKIMEMSAPSTVFATALADAHTAIQEMLKNAPTIIPAEEGE